LCGRGQRKRSGGEGETGVSNAGKIRVGDAYLESGQGAGPTRVRVKVG